jgi:hypothetical protein
VTEDHADHALTFKPDHSMGADHIDTGRYNDMRLQSVKNIAENDFGLTLADGTHFGLQISSTVGTMHNGTGFIAGRGGSGSINMTRTNVEKLRIAIFTSGEVNVQLECQPVFSIGHVVTIVKRGTDPLVYHNQTTGGWFHYRLGLTLGQMGVVAGAMLVLVYLMSKAFGA